MKYGLRHFSAMLGAVAVTGLFALAACMNQTAKTEKLPEEIKVTVANEPAPPPPPVIATQEKPMAAPSVMMDRMAGLADTRLTLRDGRPVEQAAGLHP